jgi:Peptidase family M28
MMAVMDVPRAVIDELASIPRLPTSDGERAAAYLIRDRLAGYGCRAAVEEVSAYRSYAWPIGVLSAVGVVSAMASLRGHRIVGAIGGAAAAAGIVDDISGGAMLCRRAAMRPGTAYNVVAETGDPASSRTLVVLAHDDAAPSGYVFDQSVTEWLADRRPDIVEAMRSNPPLWWPVIAGPALVALGSVTGSRRLRWLGLVGALGSLAAMVDIGRRPAVPGANDNLSGVAATVALADRLARNPLNGLRVLLVSAGAEEALQEGIRGFARNHFGHLRQSVCNSNGTPIRGGTAWNAPTEPRTWCGCAAPSRRSTRAPGEVPSGCGGCSTTRTTCPRSAR